MSNGLIRARAPVSPLVPAILRLSVPHTQQPHRGSAAPDPPTHHHHPRVFVLRAGSRRGETVAKAEATAGTSVAGEAGEQGHTSRTEKPRSQ
ncbi:hypothetical protein Q5P01_023529 [Channa striata]|uniref:Uncharacterized protein n=1 Tax=Channa striata TaxID=64152 RepID=A0AA88ITS3_CHASR|nr:hypothetical protein Q5P01_023529 [Channa striata]